MWEYHIHFLQFPDKFPLLCWKQHYDIKQSQNNITLTYVVATTVTSADLNDSIKMTIEDKILNNELCKSIHSHYYESQVTYKFLCLR